MIKNKVTANVPLRQQQDKPVTHIWEGMERFMKAVDIIGLTNVELKEFQNKAEMQFEEHGAEIDSKVNKIDYNAEMR